ncbi:6058_t:CDS:2 [Funneliformis geosporum]|uniref:6058_t:CDS:1 n=1 Tax=Funneliformis geosporum TaxID=1117311 RepID=A0A9W4SU97_9GLOM|nr:6058_t:CDS:2 [Funneliformis geosporum]
MSNDKSSLDYLLIYSFLFLNKKVSSLYNAYDWDEVDNKLVIKIDQDGNCAPKAVIDIDASQEDMEIFSVKIQEKILEGLIIATSLNSNKCSYHILYASALLIDHCELKASTKLVYTITSKKFCKFIDQKLSGQNFNLRLIGLAKKGLLECLLCKHIYDKDQQWFSRIYVSSGIFIVKCFRQSSNNPEEVFEYNPSIAEKIRQENKNSSQSSHKRQKYMKRAISNDVNLLVLFMRHSYSNTIITTRLNLKSYCDIDASERENVQGIVRALKTNFSKLRIKEYHGKSDPEERLMTSVIMIDFLRKAGMCISIIELIPKPEDNTISLSQTVKGSSSIIKAEEVSAITNATIVNCETTEFLKIS